MMRGACALLALGGVAGVADAAAAAPSCAKTGVAYSEDRDTASTLPNGAYLASSLDCQQSCKMMPDCTHFTWKEDTFPGGACYLFTMLGKETVDEKAISGPKVCVEKGEVAPTVAPLVATLAPVKAADAAGVTLAPAPTIAAVPVAAVTEAPLGATPAEVTTSGNGGNTMVYGLVGGLAGAIAVAGGAYYFMSGGKKKSKTSKKNKRSTGVEQAAPMIEEAPEPAAPAQAAPVMTSGMEQYQGMMMYPAAQQAQMTPVPQFYQQVPAYQPMTTSSVAYQPMTASSAAYQPMTTSSVAYGYQYPGVQVAAPLQ